MNWALKIRWSICVYLTLSLLLRLDSRGSPSLLVTGLSSCCASLCTCCTWSSSINNTVATKYFSSKFITWLEMCTSPAAPGPGFQNCLIEMIRSQQFGGSNKLFLPYCMNSRSWTYRLRCDWLCFHIALKQTNQTQSFCPNGLRSPLEKNSVQFLSKELWKGLICFQNEPNRTRFEVTSPNEPRLTAPLSMLWWESLSSQQIYQRSDLVI